ncbi:MAG: sigma-70 family RNA polymerase sigma factor [Candidatus Solibacter sp.]
MSSGFTRSEALTVLHAKSDIDHRHGHERLEEDVVALFERFHAPLLRYLASCGVPFPDGEEVIQEVFLSLFQHLQSGKSRENLAGWLFRVAHNLALKRRHRIRRDFDARTGAAGENQAVDRQPTPEDQVVSAQAQQRLLAVVRALPEQDRRCLSLRAEGLRYREIAEILGMSLGAVSLSLSRSLARITRSAER